MKENDRRFWIMQISFYLIIITLFVSFQSVGKLLRVLASIFAVLFFIIWAYLLANFDFKSKEKSK